MMLIAANEVKQGDQVYTKSTPEDPWIYEGVAVGDANQDDELVWFTVDDDGIVDNCRLDPREYVLVIRPLQ